MSTDQKARSSYQEIIMSVYGPAKDIRLLEQGYSTTFYPRLLGRTPEQNPHLMVTSLRTLADSETFKYFPTIRLEYSPFRGASLPLRRASSLNNYLRLYDIKRKRRGTKSVEEYYISMSKYVKFLGKIENVFGDMFGSLDTDVVLKATAPLGFVRPNHYDMDEKGVFGVRRTYRFPEALVKHTFAHFSSFLPPARVTELSMRRGTNLGWPTPKAGRSRDESDLLLILHAAYTQGCKRSNMSLSQSTDQLQSIFGPCFTIAGERYQETERILPNLYEGSTIISDHGGIRTRGIYFSPKYMVIWNRPVVKTVLKALLASPFHTQDRNILKNHLAKKWDFSISLDVSAFDQSFGNGAQDQAQSIIAELGEKAGIGNRDKIFLDLQTEFSVPNIVPTSRDTYITSGGEILSSGLAATSLIGTITSHMLLMELMAQLTGLTYSKLENSHGTNWIGYSWGDDVVICWDSSFSSLVRQRHPIVKHEGDVLSVIKQIGDQMQLKFDAEPTRKFLGQHYDIGSFTSDTATIGIPVGRWVQRQFFPERLKTYPFDRIGYLARLYMLGDHSVAKEIHVRCQKQFGIGLDVQFTGDPVIDMLPFIIDAQSHSDDIRQLDDVINTFTHGLDEFDTDLSLADIFGEEFVDLLGAQQIRVDDVSEWLGDDARKRGLSLRIRNLIASLAESGNPVIFSNTVVEIARLYNSNTPYAGRALYY